jgi:hypothetical protein
LLSDNRQFRVPANRQLDHTRLALLAAETVRDDGKIGSILFGGGRIA